MKTYKNWVKANVNLNEYMGNIPCEIDEELYMYCGEIVAPQYISENFNQIGEPSFKKHGVYHYSTCSSFNGKYYYLGVLPEFVLPHHF